jgi:hypothetical protein
MNSAISIHVVARQPIIDPDEKAVQEPAAG